MSTLAAINYGIQSLALFVVLSEVTLAACIPSKITPSDHRVGQGFGYSVAAGADFVAVGAPSDDEHGTFAGAVYVWNDVSGSLTQGPKLAPADAGPNAFFGGALAVSGDTMLIGASSDDDQAAFAGAAYVFRRLNGVWSQEAKLAAPDGAAQDYFGGVVAIHTDSAAISSLGQDAGADGAGAVYLFFRNGATWNFGVKLTDPDPRIGGRFGHSLGVWGDWVAVGSNITDRVRLYHRSGLNWQLDSTLTALDPPPGDTGFGNAIAVNNQFLTISAIHMNSHEGVVFLYSLAGGQWAFAERLDAPDHFPLGHFGWSVGLSGENLVVGADFSKEVFFFRNVADRWRLQGSFQSADPNEEDGFGSRVAIGPAIAVAGAPDDATAFEGGGAGYVFKLTECLTPIPASSLSGLLVMAATLLACGIFLGRRRGKATQSLDRKFAGQ